MTRTYKELPGTIGPSGPLHPTGDIKRGTVPEVTNKGKGEGNDFSADAVVAG